MRRVVVSAPASIANLGCLFDIAAIAIDYARDKVIVEEVENSGIEVISLSKEVPGGKANTAFKAAEAILRRLDMIDNIGLRIIVVKGVKKGIGIGSSGATAAATVAAIKELLKEDISNEELIQAAGEGESVAAGSPHYDNVSASLLGGITIIVNQRPMKVIRILPPRELSLILITPKVVTRVEQDKGKTQIMRSILPDKISLKEAVEQNCAVAEFMTALMKGDLELLGEAISKGGIVERVRSRYIPHYWTLKEISLKAGGLGANISGAGPSIFVIVEKKESIDVAHKIEEYIKKINVKADVVVTQPDNKGAIREE